MGINIARLFDFVTICQNNKKMKKTSGVILLLLLRNSLCIPLSQFYSFGTGNAVPTGDDNSSPSISLKQQIRFFGQSHTSLFVSDTHYFVLL